MVDFGASATGSAQPADAKAMQSATAQPTLRPARGPESKESDLITVARRLRLAGDASVPSRAGPAQLRRATLSAPEREVPGLRAALASWIGQVRQDLADERALGPVIGEKALGDRVRPRSDQQRPTVGKRKQLQHQRPIDVADGVSALDAQ